MSEDEKDRYIRSLIDKINMFEVAVEEKARAIVKDEKIIDNQ